MKVLILATTLLTLSTVANAQSNIDNSVPRVEGGQVTSPLPAPAISTTPTTSGTRISPNMIGGSTIPGTPNPPQNPSQTPSPSAPGVTVTLPTN